MSDQFDRFGDYINDSKGIFSDGLGAMGDGLERFDRVIHQIAGPGDGLLAHVVVEMACRHCGNQRQITVEWPELVAIRVGVNPFQVFRSDAQLRRFASNWVLANVPGEPQWMPDDDSVRCRYCHQLVQPHFSSRECLHILADMTRKHWLSPSDEEYVGKVCQGYGR